MFDHTDPYTSKPTHLRIYREDMLDEYPWHLDGADDEGRYTEEVFRFKTMEEAVVAIPDFINATGSDGVVWKMGKRSGLRKSIRANAHLAEED